MSDDDRAIDETIEAEPTAAAKKSALPRRELAAIESTVAQVVELLLRTTGREDLVLDFLNGLGRPRRTLH